MGAFVLFADVVAQSEVSGGSSKAWGAAALAFLITQVLNAVVWAIIKMRSSWIAESAAARGHRISEIKDVLEMVDEERTEAKKEVVELRERVELLEDENHRQDILLTRYRDRTSYLEDVCQHTPGVTVRPWNPDESIQVTKPTTAGEKRV